jgi:hypothetical protein
MGLYFWRMACEAPGGSIAVIDVDSYQTCVEIRMPSQRPPLDATAMRSL